LTKKKAANSPGSVLYGIHPVEETLIAGRRRVEVVYLSRNPKKGTNLYELLGRSEIPVKRVSVDQIQSIAGTPDHQGICARVESFPYSSLKGIVDGPKSGDFPLLILDEVQDPRNLGSILRSAECLGVKGVILPKDRAVEITPVVEKAAAGASAHLPVARVVNLVRAIEELKNEGYWVYAADVGAKGLLYSVDLSGKVAFVLGAEGRGIRRLVRERCDLGIAIPLEGSIASLNVSQAATIILAEALRQRKMTGE
jgi:23S rRNA (guanosine2251-2'-O)-methyltransferase